MPKKQVVVECERELSLQEHLILLCKEFEVMLANNIPTRIQRGDGETLRGILNEEVNIEQEVRQYLDQDISKRTIFPINEYNQLLHSQMEDIPVQLVQSKTKRKKKLPAFEETNRGVSIVELAHLIKGELEIVLNYKLPTRVTLLGKNATMDKRCIIIHESLSAGYETQRYIMFMYNTANGYDVSAYNRVVHPVHDYKLQDMVRGMPEMCFLSIFAEIKNSV